MPGVDEGDCMVGTHGWESMMRILHIEDDPVDARMVWDFLRENGWDAGFDRVDSREEFKQQLERGVHSLILSDYSMPGVSAVELLKLARQVRPEVPFIFVSGTLGEEVALETLRMGATDYVHKSRMERLSSVMRRALDEAAEHERRKQAEDALARSNARFNAIISSAMDAIISIDAGQRVILFNPAAEKMFGLKSKDALGQPIERFIPERYRTAHHRDVEHFGHTGVSARRMGALGRVFGLRIDGAEFPIEASISQIEVEGERIYTVILRDITERTQSDENLKRVKDDLARANADLERKVQERTAQLVEANVNLQTFANTAAHDLRALLRSISGFSAVALEEYGKQLDKTGRSYLNRIQQAAEQTADLLNDLLDYSRMTQAQLELEPVDLSRVVREALALLGEDIRARKAEVQVDEQLPAVIGHPATLVLILNNLLSNALKFVAADVQPRIRIHAEPGRGSGETNAKSEALEFEPDGGVSGKMQANTVRLWIEDNGIGIEPQDLGKLFGVFQRLHGKHAYPGSGLGLAIVRRGAERMGGRVGVQSQPGKGSQFWVELVASRRSGAGRQVVTAG